MYTYIYIYIYICIHIHTYTHTHTYIYVHPTYHMRQHFLLLQLLWFLGGNRRETCSGGKRVNGRARVGIDNICDVLVVILSSVMYEMLKSQLHRYFQ